MFAVNGDLHSYKIDEHLRIWTKEKISFNPIPFKA